MEEILFKEEYIINGERYWITISKVEKDTPTNEVEEVVEASDFNEVITDEDGVVYFSIEDIPNGIDLDTWLSIYKDCGIILTK